MKRLIRLSIFVALVIWLAFYGGWAKVCSSFHHWQNPGDNPEKRSAAARGVSDALKRHDDIYKIIKKDGSDSE